MKSKLRVGDYIAPKKNKMGDSGERFEVISISDSAVKVLNLKKAWEVIEFNWDELLESFCSVECIEKKAISIESLIKKIQKNLKNKIHEKVSIDLGKIEAVIFPLCENLLELVVYERISWSGALKTKSYELPNELEDFKEAYPLLTKNIWEFPKDQTGD